MHGKSSNFAKVIFLDKEGILARLSDCSRALRANPNVLEVRLFGSLVRGDCTPGSDADVLIILKNDVRRMIDRIPEYLDSFRNVPVPVDVFPYTENEVRKMKAEGNALIREATEKGQRL
jgi:uncharacterized protein